MDWTPKSPNDARLYSYDLSEIYPDQIVTAVFTRTSGTVTLEGVPPDPRTAYVIVSGGTNGETAVLSLAVATSLDQSFTRTINLRIATDADAIDPASSITKGSLIIRALGKLGLANYVFDTEAEEDNSALRQLDSLAARWQGKLEPFGYVQPASNGISLPSDSAGIREEDVDTFISNLALALAPDYGKTPAPGLVKQAAESRSEFFCKYARRFEYQLPNRLPTGAGNDRFLGRRFFPSCR
jgi:hypothetical protein